MVRRVFGVAIGFVSVAMFLIFLFSFTSSVSIARHVRSTGTQITDLLFYADTFQSHRLLPDANLTIDLDNTAQHDEDLHRIERVFPDDAERRLVIDWGRRLFDTARRKHLAADDFAQNLESAAAVSAHQVLHSMQVSNALAAHAAWRRLMAAAGSREADLFDLFRVVTAAAGSPEQLRRLLEWAKRRGPQKEVLRVLPKSNFELTVRPRPPDLDWFRYFALYEDWCITEPLFAARRSELLDRFGAKQKGSDRTWRALLGLGEQALEDRAGRGASRLPDDGERAKVVAAVDRISGLEPGRREQLEEGARFLLWDVTLLGRAFQPNPKDPHDFGPPQLSFVVDAAPRAKTISIPNDGVYAREYRHFREYDEVDALPFVPYALVSNKLGLGAAIPEDPIPVWSGFVALWIGSATVLYYLAATYGHRLVIVGLPGIFPTFRRLEAYRNLRQKFWPYVLGKWIPVPAAGLLLSVAEVYLRPISDNEDILFASSLADPILGILAATLWGSVLTDIMEELVQIGLIALGRDPDQRAKDVISSRLFVMLCTAALMRYFQNDWTAIFNSAVLGFIDVGFWSAARKFVRGEQPKTWEVPPYRVWEFGCMGLGGLALMSGPWKAFFGEVAPASDGEVEMAGTPAAQVTPKLRTILLTDFVARNRSALKVSHGLVWAQRPHELSSEDPVETLVDTAGRPTALAIRGKPWLTWDNDAPVYVWWGNVGERAQPLSTWARERGEYETSQGTAEPVIIDGDRLKRFAEREKRPYTFPEHGTFWVTGSIAQDMSTRREGESTLILFDGATVGRYASGKLGLSVTLDPLRERQCPTELLQAVNAQREHFSDSLSELHKAVVQGDLARARELLGNKADVAARADKEVAALHLAAFAGSPAMASLLLEHGAELEVMDAEGRTPLGLAAQLGRLDTMDLLLKRGALSDPKGAPSVLTWAAAGGSVEAVKALLAKGASATRGPKGAPLPLLRAARNGYLAVVELLITNGARMDELSATPPMSALMGAAGNGQEDVVEWLLAKGAKPDAVEKDGLSALHIAAHRGYVPIVESLLKHGAHVNLQTKSGETPLHLAIDKWHLDVASVLLAHKANPQLKATPAGTALESAQRQKHFAMIALLESAVER